MTVATVVTPLMGSFQSIFGFEFLVLDGRTDRSSFTNGGPRNGGKSSASENIEARGRNGGDGDYGGNGYFVFGCESGEGANEGRGGDGGDAKKSGDDKKKVDKKHDRKDKKKKKSSGSGSGNSRNSRKQFNRVG
ncbi:MAG: hypothetical protein ACRD8Z_10465 [Nitrososphaeraceae archaeon]